MLAGLHSPWGEELCEAKDAQGNVIQGSKYYADYDFVPALTSELWDDFKKFLAWRREQMLDFMEKHYGIKIKGEEI